MGDRRYIAIGLIALVLAGWATPAMSMDRFERIWLRDATFGAGAGLIVGLATQNTGTLFLVGLVAGGIFGYFDARDGMTADAIDPAAPWAPAPRITVESRPIDGRALPEQILKATVYQARW